MQLNCIPMAFIARRPNGVIINNVIILIVDTLAVSLQQRATTVLKLGGLV